MNSPEDDNSLSFDNDEEKDEFQEKLDFEENELISKENFEDFKCKKNTSLISSSSINCSSGEEGLIEKDDTQDQAKENSKTKIFKLTNVIKNGEDGELNDDSDDDLEEGELKDEDDNIPVNQSLDQIIKNEHQKKILCKFYSNGLCSWGDQCRFLHSGKINPPIVNNYKPQSINHQQQQFPRTYQKSQFNKQYDNNQSDPDYDSRYDSYERKRRLAFISLESAPWNNDPNYIDQRNRLTDDRKRDDDLDYKNQSNSSFSDFSSSEKSFKQHHQHSPLVNRKRKLSGQLSSTTTNVNKDHYSKREWNNDSSPASSFFSDSADEFDQFDNDKIFNNNKAKSPSSTFKRKRSRSKERHSRDSSKDDLKSNLKDNSKSLDQYSSSKMRSKHTSHRRPVEKEEKKPINMTFMRKQSNLSKGNKFSSEEEDNPDDDFEIYGSKDLDVKTTKVKPTEESTNKTSGTSREELLKRLKEIDEAIAKKRSRI